MSYDIADLRTTIVPKSDQLNADQLVDGDMTITITDVRMGSEDQPVILHYEGDEGRPYKPCKTMRKLLIFAWGEDGREWVGRSMTLYNDHAVKFGGMSVGGIRISHMSDISKEISVALNSTKGKKAQHIVQVLEVMRLENVLKAIEAIKDKPSQAKAKAMAAKLTKQADHEKALKAYSDKISSFKKPKPTTLSDRITAAHDLETCQALGEEITAMPAGPEQEALTQQLLERESALAPK